MYSVRASMTLAVCTVLSTVSGCAFDKSGEASDQDLDDGGSRFDSTFVEDTTRTDEGTDVVSPMFDSGGSPDVSIDTRISEVDSALDTHPTDTALACTGSELPYEGHCYSVDLVQHTFLDARKACSAPGAHLVTINSSAEDAFVSAITIGLEAWMGLTRDPEADPKLHASFKWITGEPTSVDGWRIGEPDGSGQCARHTATGWADSGCAEMFAAVCERQ